MKKEYNLLSNYIVWVYVFNIFIYMINLIAMKYCGL